MNYFGGTSPHFSVDRISSTDATVFTCEENFGRMVKKNSGNYNVVSSSVVMGAIANGDSLNLKPYFIAELVYDFLDYDPPVKVNQIQTEITSAQAYPNPALSKTQIEYYLKNPGQVEVSVYDMKGRLVKTIFDGKQQRGLNSLLWDINNKKGQRVKEGLYFYQIESGGNVITGKITIL